MTRRIDRFATALPIVTVFLALMMAGCATAGPPLADAPGATPLGARPSAGAGLESQTLVAYDLAFDRAELLVPAGQAFNLTLENRDSAPHNVSITDIAGVTRFSGEIFGGPDSRRYEVPALEAGTYTFRCDIHASMTGELVSTPPEMAD